MVPNTLHHTRLFIFNTNLEDYIDNATQFKQVSLDTTAFQVQVNRELKSALNFLITPFADAQDTLFIPQIKFYFDEHEVDITFPYDTLALAESIHNFRFEPTEDGMLNYGLNIKPWFIERVHRALVKAEAFKRLKSHIAFTVTYWNAIPQELKIRLKLLRQKMNWFLCFTIFSVISMLLRKTKTRN